MIKKLFTLSLLLLCGLFLTSCFKGVQSDHIDLNKGKYIVTFSKTFTPSVKLNVYSVNGEILEEIERSDTQTVDASIRFNNQIFFTSERSNTHYSIDLDSTKITPFSFGEARYGKKQGYGVRTLTSSSDIILGFLNVGMTERGYACHLYYKFKQDDKWQDLELYEGFVNSAQIVGNKGVFHFSNDDGGQLVIIDLMHKRVEKKVSLQDASLESLPLSSKSMLIDEACLLMIGKIGNGNVLAKNGNKKHPKIVKMTLSEYKIIEEYIFEEAFQPDFLFVVKGKYYVVATNGEVKVLNKNLKLIESKRFDYNQDNVWIGEIKYKDNQIYCLYRKTPDKEHYSEPGKIVVYDAVSFKEISRTPLKLLKSDDWWGEYISFDILN